MQHLLDRMALVTGGAQGLGAALALRLAEEGCDVAIADLNLDQTTATAHTIAAATGRRCLPLAVNVGQ